MTEIPEWLSESAWRADGPIYLQVTWADPHAHPMYASDLVGALWHIELLYDFAVLLAHPAYQDVDLSRPQEFFTAGWLSLADEHRLQVDSVEHHSPLLFLALIPAVAAGAGAIWAITQTAEKVANFRLNRRKLRAEVTKAEAEAKLAQAAADSAEYQQLLDRRRANATADELSIQIQASAMRVTNAELTEERPAA
jgi:hypothetical protein